MQNSSQVFGKPVCEVKCSNTHCRIKFVDDSFLFAQKSILDEIPKIREFLEERNG